MKFNQCESFQSLVQVFDILVLVVFCIIVIISVSFTVIIFFYRTKSQRPNFVIAHMILLNLFSVCFAIYFILTTFVVVHKGGTDMDGGNDLKYIRNTAATFGNIFLVSKDWIFTE